MFGEYALAGAFNSDDQDYYESELSAHLFPAMHPPHPWSKGGNCEEDFVMIGEFSELEGPKPLILIPKDGGGRLDLNSFVVKIMAVDHQTPTAGFNITEDTQVVMSEGKDGIYAYVHHFVLNDHEARGFVRPFCMTYVTPDQRPSTPITLGEGVSVHTCTFCHLEDQPLDLRQSKLMTFYEDMNAEFQKVSRYFKYGNRMVFVQDLEKYLKDLQYTKEFYIAEYQEKSIEMESMRTNKEVDPQEQKGRSDSFESFLKSVNSITEEVQDILITLKPLLNDRRLEQRFQKLEDKTCKERESLSASLQASNSYGDSHLLNPLMVPVSRKSTSSSYCNGLFQDRKMFSMACDHKPKLVDVTRRRRFDDALRGLHGLSMWGAKEGLNRLRSIHKYFSRDLATLEIEKYESGLIDPHPSLLTFGRCVATNFMHNINLKCAGRTWPLNKAAHRGSHPTSNLLRRWLSNDTLDSFKSVSSFLSTRDDEDSPMSSVRSSYEPAFIMGHQAITDGSVSDEFEEIPDQTPVFMEDMFTSSGLLDRFGKGSEEMSTPREDNTFDVTSEISNPDTLLERINPDPLLDINSPDNSECSSCECPFPAESPNSGSRRESMDATATIQPQVTAIKVVRVAVFSSAEHIYHFGPSSEGFDMLRFLSSYGNNIHHVLYSLMTGRTVAVIGSVKMEKQVHSCIDTLLMFLPGYSSYLNAVVYWQSKPIKFADLGQVKLIGLYRANAVPRILKRYVTILDIEKNVIIGPLYQGTYLHSILSKRKLHRTDESFVAYIHSVLLEIATVAFLYFQAFCLNPPDPGNTSKLNEYHQAQLLNKKADEFLNQLGVKDCDIRIIKYLTDLIMEKQQQDNQTKVHSDKDTSVRSLSFHCEQNFIWKV